MNRVTKKSCKLCRREGEKLFLKGERCFSTKCAFGRRSYAPGPHGKRPRKLSEYGIRLREKQKARRIYGLSERQFKKYFKIAAQKAGITGENLLILLEKRLDNVIFRLNLADSRVAARQFVGHGHFLVNNRKCNICSRSVKRGDEISIIEKSKEVFKKAVEKIKDRQLPPWLVFNPEKMSGKITAEVSKAMIDTPLDERLIVEHYSR